MRRLLFLLLLGGGAAYAARRRQSALSAGPSPTGNPAEPPPAPDAPGPAVAPTGAPADDEDAGPKLDPDVLAERADDPVEALVAEEEAAAAAEAAAIGGRVDHDSDDPAMDPVYQAGGGVAEGFEAAEADLIENASHGDGHGNPLRDAMNPEVESDEVGVRYGEADDVIVPEDDERT